jgi:FAD/FMN-containing dehydrogenase
VSLSPSQLAELRALLGDDGVLASEAARFTYEADALALEKAMPDVVVLPRSTEQVAALVRWACERGIPVTARGAGTGLAGGATPERGGIVLSVNRMDELLSVDAERRFAWVQPGLVNLALSQRLAPRGLYYAPDPASQQVSTIGGNVATNAGGPHCLKYGVTMNHVLGVVVVLHDGATSTSPRSSSAARARSGSSPRSACACCPRPRRSRPCSSTSTRSRRRAARSRR